MVSANGPRKLLPNCSSKPSAVVIRVGGALWPHSQPSAAMLAAYAADPALAAMRLDFTDGIREVLAVMAAGLLARRP